MSESTSQPATEEAAGDDRRGFLSSILALCIGGIITLAPLAAGLLVFLDPLRKRKPNFLPDQPNLPDPNPEEPGQWVKVTTLDALPDDGTPQRFTLIADKADAWNYYPQEPVGAVFLRKAKKEAAGGDELVCFTTICPHLGCSVDYRQAVNEFHCPCHDSSFTIEGEIQAGSPSPRGLDDLPVLVMGDDVWVKYQKFHAASAVKKVEG